MSPSHDLPCRLARLLFAITMALIWTGGANHAGAQVPNAADTPVAAATLDQSAVAAQAAAEQFDRSVNAIADAARAMPRDSFDAAAVVAQVGNDPVHLFEWVRDQTAWVAYRGVLRAETGVLMDRLGNSLDRALLLAALLRTSGHTVRLARGQIPADDARALLAKVRTVAQLNEKLKVAGAPTTRPAGDPLGEATRTYQIDDRSARTALQMLAMQQQRLEEAMAARLAAQVPVLAKLLDRKPQDDPQPALDANRAAAAAALQDHWWVQRQQPDQSWQDLDPLLPDAAPGAAVARAAETCAVDQLPTDQFQEVELRVVIERRDGRAAKEFTLLRHALRPSKLIGTTVTVGNLPLDWPEIKVIGEAKVLERFKAAAVAQREWAATLRIGNGDPIIQSSVTAGGEVNEKPALLAQKRAGKGVGSAGSDAAGLLSADPPPPPASTGEFTAQWLEYEIRVPNEPPQVIRREIFDLVGAAARAKGAAASPFQMTDHLKTDRALAMLAQTQVCLMPCRLSPQFMFHRWAADLQANRAGIKAILADRGNDPAALEKQVRAFQPMLGDLHLLALLRDMPAWAGGYLYYDRPVVLTQRGQLRQGLGGALSASKAFDIVSNQMGVYPTCPFAPSAVQLVQGVTDTNAEALLFGQHRRSGNSADELAKADDRGEEWIMLDKPGDTGRSALPADAQSRIEKDLAAGYRVLCPADGGKVDGVSNATWRRVDPRTGQTLGFNGQGWGASAAEWIAVAMLVGFTAGLLGCMFAMTSGGGAMTAADVQTCVGVACICAALAGVAMLTIELAAAGAAAGGAAAAAGGGGAAAGGGGGAAAAGGGGAAAGGGGAAAAGGGGAAAAGGGGAAAAGGGGAAAAGGGGAAAAAGGGVSPLAGTISPAAGTFGGGAIGAGAGGAVVEGGGFAGGGAFTATGGAAGGVVGGGGAVGGGALAATQAGGAAAAGTGGAVGAFTGGSGGGTLLILPTP